MEAQYTIDVCLGGQYVSSQEREGIHAYRLPAEVAINFSPPALLYPSATRPDSNPLLQTNVVRIA